MSEELASKLSAVIASARCLEAIVGGLANDESLSEADKEFVQELLKDARAITSKIKERRGDDG